MNLSIFIISIIILLIDQISKIIINIYLNGTYTIINNFFYLENVKNYGASFSILSDKVNLLILLTVIAIIIIINFMYNFKLNKRNSIAFGFLLGGICGNLIDRIFLGYVRDFISFKIFSYYFPIFNIADTFIVIGVILLIFAIIKGEDKK